MYPNPKATNKRTATPIRVPKTAELVASHFRDRIVRGELSEGDTLNPEGQLIEEFSVSRPTLREAFRILEAENLISVSRGSRGGARVQLPAIDVAARYAGLYLQSKKTTIAEIYEVRCILEPEVVANLAKKRSQKMVSELRACIDEEEKHINDPDSWVGSATRFHHVLFELAGNKAFEFVAGILEHILEAHLRHIIGENAQDYSPKQAARDIRSQRKLVDLIEAGDVEGAEAHWKLHTLNVAKVLLKTTGAKAIVDIVGS